MQGNLWPEHISDIDRRDMILQYRVDVKQIAREIIKLQETCPHNDVERTAMANTGNWCKADDAYWKDCKCRVCDYAWQEDYKDGYTQ